MNGDTWGEVKESERIMFERKVQNHLWNELELLFYPENLKNGE